MAMVKWTEDQQSAIDTRHCNLLVAAAAGSGKTAVLVERIIKIITNEENPVDIDKLLVVTFTNAAAAEMRERIGEAITKALDKNPENTRLQRQLTLLNKASITTIHSFCLQVIKNNFHRIELDPGFRIGDATEGVLLKQETLSDLFEEKYEVDEYGNVDEAFLQLVESYGGSKDDVPLQEIVQNLYGFIMSGPWPKKWIKETTEAFNVKEDFNFGQSKWGKILISNLKVELLGFIDRLSKAINMALDSKGLEPYGETLREDLSKIEYLLEVTNKNFNDIYEGFLNLKFSTIKRCGKDVDKEVQEKVKAIRDEIKKKIDKIKEEIFSSSEEEIKEYLKELYPMMKALGELVLDFDERYKARKRERGILDFNDLEHLALSILTEEDEDGNIIPSEAALELRETFDEVLIDEYQDSNNVQEVILSSISRKNTENPNVFMVGDVKQSIYRFRQAEPQLFLSKYMTYSEKEGDKNRKITLFKNFRSREEVIDAVNYVFKLIMSYNIGELEYTEREALNLGANFKENTEEDTIVGGPVELHLLDKKGKDFQESSEENTESVEEGLEDEEEELDGMQLEARLIGKRIKELMILQEGKRFKVYDKNIEDYRPVQFRDIVILLRATSKWAEVFMEELVAMGIPVYSDSGSGYFDTIEVQTMMSLLQIIDNPMQDIPLLSVLSSPIFAFTPEELMDIRMINKELSLYESLKEIAKACSNEDNEAVESPLDIKLCNKAYEFLESLKKWRDKSVYTAIDELIWYLYTETGYYGYAGAMPSGIQRQANLRMLFERARQYEETSYKGLFNFITFVNKLRLSSGDMGSAKVLGENENVVRIMSIHKSKGLEFPVVFLSGTGKNFNLMDMNRSILFHQELGLGPNYVDYIKRISFQTILKQALKKKIKLESLSEEMRILYVALTRAKEKLIITGAVNNLEDYLKRWASNGLSENGKLPEFEVLKGRNYLDWICPSLAKHIDCNLIREKGNATNEVINSIIKDNSQWEIKFWGKSDIIVDKKNEAVDQKQEEIISIENYLDKKEEENESTIYSEEINRRLSFEYEFREATRIPAKISVTELKRQRIEEFTDEFTHRVYVKGMLKKPKFLEEKKGLTAAEKGTIMHSVMQHLDYSKVNSREDIVNQVKEMIEKEFITEIQASSVNIDKILRFFSSELGKRVLNAQTIHREVPFYIELKASEVYNDLSKAIYERETILLQGVIDCYFKEHDNIILLDYKTDYAIEENMNEIQEKYKVQIDYYSEALKRITGESVKEKYIYLFSNGKTITY